ncbi:unnamed protein product [Ectocarpus sp. CCAP 1310/34]|nr:unnamed protein product [Ectocarpus sp. CCAP 1310/34]
MGKRRLVDGGPDSLRYSLRALEGGDYEPYESFTQAFLAGFIRIASPSRSQLGLLFHCVLQTDKDGNGINPVDVPDSADHFLRDMREKGNGGAATSGVEDASDGPTRLAVSIPAGVMIQRMLDSPGFVEKLLAVTSGHTLSETDRVNGRVPDAQVMIPTRRTNWVRQGAVYGDFAACSSTCGVDSIMVGQGDKEDRVVVGNTVMVVDVPGQAEGADALPCRLESLVWNKDCYIAGGGSNDRIVARVQRCLLNSDLSAETKVEEDAPSTKTGVQAPSLETRKAARLFYDRRRTGNHWNNGKERRVFLTSAHLSTDAFDFRNQASVSRRASYSIKATLLSPFASTSQAFRQPGAWLLVGLSALRVRW